MGDAQQAELLPGPQQLLLRPRLRQQQQQARIEGGRRRRRQQGLLWTLAPRARCRRCPRTSGRLPRLSVLLWTLWATLCSDFLPPLFTRATWPRTIVPVFMSRQAFPFLRSRDSMFPLMRFCLVISSFGMGIWNFLLNFFGSSGWPAGAAGATKAAVHSEGTNCKDR